MNFSSIRKEDRTDKEKWYSKDNTYLNDLQWITEDRNISANWTIICKSTADSNYIIMFLMI